MKIVFTFLLICLPGSLCEETTPIITLNDGGMVRGAFQRAHEGKVVSEYLGIPYAQPPIGDRRFEVPLPVKPWNYVLNATTMSRSCYQLLVNDDSTDVAGGQPDINEMSEDCLYLNIWVPRTMSNDLLPVTFYVHGGSFMKGSSAQKVHNGKFLAAEMETILVTFNYRLAMFGFFYAGIRDGSANVGIRDQIEAFRWVVKNIIAFGGDPAKITLVGNSAGAASVGFLSRIPYINSIVRRLIMYSGVPDAPWASHDRNKAQLASKWLAKKVNCSCDEVISTSTVKCLKKVSPAILAKYSLSEEAGLDLIWKPVVDGQIVKLDQISENVDILIGTTSDEAASFVGRMLAKRSDLLKFTTSSNILKVLFHREIKKLFPYRVSDVDFDQIFQIIMHLYGPRNGEFDVKSLISALNNIASDYLFNCPADRFAKSHAMHGHNVYKYVFDHMVSTKKYPSSWGVVHSSDLPIIFCNPLDDINSSNKKFTSNEVELCRRTARFSANFQKTG